MFSLGYFLLEERESQNFHHRFPKGGVLDIGFSVGVRVESSSLWFGELEL